MSVLSDVRTLQGVIEDGLVAFASAGVDEVSLADLKESHAAEKTEFEMLLAASEKKLADVERHIETFEDNKDTLDDLMTKTDEA